MSSQRSLLTCDEVAERLLYDPQTGFLIWKPRTRGDTRWNIRFAGKRAGCLDPIKGYRTLSLNGVSYHEHRLVWMLVNRTTPPVMIDHVDGDRTNNRIENLRAATCSQNLANSRAVWGVSGRRGVHWKRREKRWAAQIMVRGKKHYLGLFRDKEEAAAAYTRASTQLNGDFSPKASGVCARAE